MKTFDENDISSGLLIGESFIRALELISIIPRKIA